MAGHHLIANKFFNTMTMMTTTTSLHKSRKGQEFCGTIVPVCILFLFVSILEKLLTCSEIKNWFLHDFFVNIDYISSRFLFSFSLYLILVELWKYSPNPKSRKLKGIELNDVILRKAKYYAYTLLANKSKILYCQRLRIEKKMFLLL